MVMEHDPSDNSLLSSICSLSAKRLHLSSSSLRASWVSERRLSSSIILRIFLRPLGVPLMLNSLLESSLPLCLIKKKKKKTLLMTRRTTVKYRRAHSVAHYLFTGVRQQDERLLLLLLRTTQVLLHFTGCKKTTDVNIHCIVCM